MPTKVGSETSGTWPRRRGRGGTYAWRFGKIRAMALPTIRMLSPNARAGRSASVSADRPTTKTPRVKTAVRAGDENDENSVATAAMMETSHRVKAPDARTSCRSGPAGSASQIVAARNAAAHGMMTKTRERLAWTRAIARTPSAGPTTPATVANGRPASHARSARTTAPSSATKTARVARVPRYFPTMYSWRRRGRARMGKMVLYSISRWSDVAPRTMATRAAASEMKKAPRSATTRVSWLSE